MRNGRINPNLLPSDLVRGSPSADARAPSLSSDPRPRTGRGERSRERWRETHTIKGRSQRAAVVRALNAAPRPGVVVLGSSPNLAATLPGSAGPPEPVAPPTHAGGASRGSFGGALAQDGREGSGRQRVKIRDAPAARGGAGRDARRGETPAASPGAKILSATAARLASGRDAPRRAASVPRSPRRPQAQRRCSVAALRARNPTTSAWVGPACGGERVSLTGAQEEPGAPDGREGSGWQRAKIRDGFW